MKAPDRRRKILRIAGQAARVDGSSSGRVPTSEVVETVDEATKFQTVAKVGDIVDGRGIPVTVDGRNIAVILDEGRYYAIDDACPHKGVPLCDGIVFGGTITCTWHGWRFNLEDGRWMDSPRTRIGTYPVRVVGDEIQVSVD